MPDTISTAWDDLSKSVGLSLVVVVGMALTVLLALWTEDLRPPIDPKAIDEGLYLNGKTARKLSLSFNGLAADWYWMRSLQYVGRKVLNVPANVPIDNLQELDLKLLSQLLDNATSLDPEFLEPYEYAAVVLPTIDVKQAINITRKGIEANPSAWRLYHHLGYIYWQQHDYQAAGEIYGRGAQIPGAPEWMQAMKAKMLAEGGSRSTAREIYTRMYEQSADDKIKEMARLRLLQLNSLDEQDALKKLLTAYQTRVGHCPATWKEFESVLRELHVPVDSTGGPLDPAGFAYVLKSNCEVELAPASEIPRK